MGNDVEVRRRMLWDKFSKKKGRILVLAWNYKEYNGFLKLYGLSRQDAKYVMGRRDLDGWSGVCLVIMPWLCGGKLSLVRDYRSWAQYRGNEVVKLLQSDFVDLGGVK